MNDLAIIITAMNEARWLEGLLPTIAPAADGLDVDIVVADIESTDNTRDLVATFAGARTVPVINKGFSHANNVALQTVDARYVLFLNADTEIVDGSFAELLQFFGERPEVGMVGVRQLDPSGSVYPTMRRFASPSTALAEALGSERLAPRRGQRVLDLSLYDRETECDWTIGSFMLMRREALMSAGALDERFFFTGEEQDLCLRVRRAGWSIVHVPKMTIVHHVGKRGISPRFAAQSAFAERQYADLNFSGWRRVAYMAALRFGYLLRGVLGGRSVRGAASRAAYRASRRGAEPPFIIPPATAVPAGQFDAAQAGEPA